MIALYLLAAHMVGDFLLQNRWQAAGKLTDRRLRMWHVFFYSVPFWPIVWWKTWDAPLSSWHAQRGGAFVVGLILLHFATDSHRFQSTIGDVIQWQYDRHVAPEVAVQSWVDHLYGPAPGLDLAMKTRLERARDITGRTLRFPPPNPWPSMPLMIDQALHVCQLALLGGIFLA